MITDLKFIPGGRYLYYAGRENKFFNNCYLLKAEDKKLGKNKSLNDPLVRDEINKLALLELRKSAHERWITKLKKTASIRQFDSQGKLITKIQEANSE